MVSCLMGDSTALASAIVRCCLINIRQNLVIEHNRPFLVVRAREKLDYLAPVFFVFAIEVLSTILIQHINGAV
jgi:hypothetical protein